MSKDERDREPQDDEIKKDELQEDIVPVQFYITRALRKDAKSLLAQDDKTWRDLLEPVVRGYVNGVD